jgi:hypothetical protein
VSNAGSIPSARLMRSLSTSRETEFTLASSMNDDGPRTLHVIAARLY